MLTCRKHFTFLASSLGALDLLWQFLTCVKFNFVIDKANKVVFLRFTADLMCVTQSENEALE